MRNTSSPTGHHLVSRRRFLGGSVAAGSITLCSPALAALRDLYRDMPEPPDAIRAPAEFRAWFTAKERLFSEAINGERVQRILHAPIDEHLDVVELDAVMREILAKWPSAFNEHIKALPEIDQPLARWADAPQHVTFPSALLRLMGTGAGNGTIISVDGETLILTAEHVAEGTMLPYVAGASGDDVALLRTADFAGRTKLTSEDFVRRAIPWVAKTPRELRAARVTIGGYDPGDALTWQNSAKIYLGLGLERTSAATLWVALHSNPDSPALAARWKQLVQMRGAPTEDRAKFMRNVRAFVASVERQYDWGTNDVLMMAPRGEAHVKGHHTDAAGMSGSALRHEGKVVGVLTSVWEVCIKQEELDGGDMLAFAICLCKTDIATAIANYRAKRDASLTR